MNKVVGSDTAGKEGECGKAHPFVEQGKLTSRAAANQTATFWKSPQPTTKKKPAPAIGTIEGPKGSFS